MASQQPRQLCPNERLSAVLATASKDEGAALHDIDGLLRQYPDDARVHFLKGSLLAGREDYPAARTAMRRAVDLAPDYAVARFQLGFLLLTSGEPFPAQEAWGPLYALPADHYLKLFVDGLVHLIKDEFADAVRSLEEGIARNHENLPMNRDMQLIIAEIHQRPMASDAPVSSVDILLQQAALKARKH